MDINEEIKRVHKVLDHGDETKVQLISAGITSLEDLFRSKEKLKGYKVEGLRKCRHDDYYSVILYLEDFQSTHASRKADILSEQDFNIDDIDKFKKKITDQKAKQEEAERALKAKQKESEWEAERDVIQQYILLVMGKSIPVPLMHKKLESIPNCRERIINCISEVLTPLFEQAAEFKNSYTKHEEELFTKPFLSHIYDHDQTDPETISDKANIMIVYGPTQCGKTSLNLVVMCLCKHLNIPLVIMTKGVREGKELSKKLHKLAIGTIAEQHIVSSFYGNIHNRTKCTTQEKMVTDGIGCPTSKQKRDEIKMSLLSGGTFVMADTCFQIAKAIKFLTELREEKGNVHHPFVLIDDEADAVYRTPDRSQKFEIAHDELIGLGPLFQFKVSATPLPVCLYHMDENPYTFKMRPSDNYNGLTCLKTFEIDGKAVYLDRITINDCIQKEVNGNTIKIEYFNEKILSLCSYALDQAKRGKQGVLVLVGTSPRVWAPGNLFEQGKGFRDFYKSQSIDIVIIVYCGKGVCLLRPGEDGFEEQGNVMINDSIEIIDNDPKYGVNTPIFVFAYTKMTRGISFRSDARVPTHLVFSLGMGHNAMNVVQTLGRTTFNGKDLLSANGWDHVSVLTIKDDLIMAKKKQALVHDIFQMLENKPTCTLRRAIMAKKADSTNFIRHTERKISQMKDFTQLCKDVTTFERPWEDVEDSDEEDSDEEDSDEEELRRRRLRRRRLRQET